MLIRSIRAENFMRFSRLDLSGIPSRGIIGIEGPNESGKTTLGEALLFGLFGKTRTSAEAPVQSLIRWGADAMSVELEFTIEPSWDARGPGAAPEVHGPGGRSYLLYRQIDRAGTNYVKIVDLDARREVAAGNIQAAEFIAREVRFDFEEFQRSFYHDQCEGRRLHGLNGACFESATGVKHLREAAREIQREVEALEREFSYYQKEITRNVAQIEKHARAASKLAELEPRSSRAEEAVSQAARRAGELKRRIEDLRAEAAARQERAKRIDGLVELPVESFAAEVGLLAGDERPGGRESLLSDEGARALDRGLREGLDALRGFSRDLTDLLEALRFERAETDRRLGDGAGPGGPADRALLEEAVSRAARTSRSRLLQAAFLLVLALISGLLLAARLRASALLPPFLGADHLEWLPWAMAGACVLGAAGSAGALFMASRHREERRRSRAALERLCAEITDLESRRAELAAVLGSTAARDARRLAEAAGSRSAGAACERGRALLERWRELLREDGEGGLKGKAAALAKIDRDLRSRLLSDAQRAERQVQEELSQEKKLQADRDRVEGEVGECRAQASRRDALEEKNRELETSAAEARAAIDLRHLACRLLEDAAGSIETRLGPALSRLVKSVIPRLTSGRYRDVKVDEDFGIKVFSSDKNDFLLVHELSGGTSQALSIALRLALSQALVAARARQLQFVFLDEPFQMMDSDRAAETLRILRVLSPDLAQFFVIQPNFSEEERLLFDARVSTRPDGTDLAVALGGGERREAAAAPASPAAGGARREDPAPHAAD
jgi:exonuclease SbcC